MDHLGDWLCNIAEEDTTTTNGEGYRLHSTNQWETVIQRISSDYVKNVAQQTMAALATSKCSWGSIQTARFPQPRGPKELKQLFGTWSNRPGNAQPVRTWILYEHGLENNNILGQTSCRNWALFRCAINVLTTHLPSCYTIALGRPPCFTLDQLA